MLRAVIVDMPDEMAPDENRGLFFCRVSSGQPGRRQGPELKP
jgi:hypothetical protein